MIDANRRDVEIVVAVLLGALIGWPAVLLVLVALAVEPGGPLRRDTPR